MPTSVKRYLSKDGREHKTAAKAETWDLAKETCDLLLEGMGLSKSSSFSINPESEWVAAWTVAFYMSHANPDALRKVCEDLKEGQ